MRTAISSIPGTQVIERYSRAAESIKIGGSALGDQDGLAPRCIPSICQRSSPSLNLKPISNLKIVNPYNQAVIGEIPYHTDAEVSQKLDAAQSAFAQWRKLTLDERATHVRAGLAKLRNHESEIAREVTLQMGKPLSQSRNEFRTLIDRAETCLALAIQALAPDILPEKPGFVRRIEHDPLGVVFNLAAWNYPLIIPINVIVPALLAGNTVLLKHSAKTPLCGARFEDAFGQLEIPHLVTNLVLTHDQTDRLIQNPGVAHVSFTGSVEGGRSVYRSCAERLIDAGLELGGKDPAYVAEDANLSFAAENVVDGACYNAGQSCCAVERAYVHSSLYDAFLEKALKLLEAYKLGDPLDEATTMGPLASRSALDLLDRQVKDAVARGARLLCGGKRMEGTTGNFFLPTLLADVPNDAEVMQEESFGPILPVAKVNDDEQALKLMNDTRYGLTASVWTASRERAERLARETKAGTIYQNRCDYLDPVLPWTGVGESGIGSTLSKYGFWHLTRRKSLHFRVEV